MINELIIENNNIGQTKNIEKVPSQEIADEDAYTMVKDLKKNHKGIIIAYLNINSI